jgi:hypothetical protein
MLPRREFRNSLNAIEITFSLLCYLPPPPSRDLSQLPPGEYVLELSALDAKKRTALAQLTFRIRPAD